MNLTQDNMERLRVKGRWQTMMLDTKLSEALPTSGPFWRTCGGSLWDPQPRFPESVIAQMLPLRLGGPAWAFAMCIPDDYEGGSAWYDLHYPADVEQKVPAPEKPIAPRLWVPYSP